VSTKSNRFHLYAYCDNNPITYVDPSGHWKKYVHYDKTVDWAMDCGIGKADACALGNADTGVDSGATWPALIFSYNAMSWHFNRNKIGNTDSRKVHFNQQFSLAVSAWKSGTGRTKALYELGRGLHALQDIRAHWNYGVGQAVITKKHYTTYPNGRTTPDYFDDINYDLQKYDIDNNGTIDFVAIPGTKRYSNTKNDTIVALKNFMSTVNYKI
jgi:hypothetical protein